MDDIHKICDELKEILEDEGYNVDTSFDGLQGLKLIKKKSYDIILQDIKLPSINGVELLKKTKQINNNIKVIILTGRPLSSKLLNEDKQFREEENEIFKFADEVFNKPFNIIKLIEKIKNL